MSHTWCFFFSRIIHIYGPNKFARYDDGFEDCGMQIKYTRCRNQKLSIFCWASHHFGIEIVTSFSREKNVKKNDLKSFKNVSTKFMAFRLQILENVLSLTWKKVEIEKNSLRQTSQFCFGTFFRVFEIIKMSSCF